MTNDVLIYFIIVIAVIFVGIIIAWLILNKKLKSKETRYIAQLVEGTKTNSFSLNN